MVDIWQRKSRKVLIISCSISFIYYLNFKEGKINSKPVPPKLKKKYATLGVLFTWKQIQTLYLRKLLTNFMATYLQLKVATESHSYIR